MADGDDALASFVTSSTDAGERFDKLIARHVTALSRSRIKMLIEAGQATIDAHVITDVSFCLKKGQRVTLTVPPPAPAKPQPQAIPLNIVYEDKELLIIDKPPGLVVHPSAGHESGTLVNALIAHCGESLSGIGGIRRPGIVHRLDKDTSGLMVVAKTDRAHRHLAKQFSDHGRSGPLERSYSAFVWSKPSRPTGTIHTGLERSAHNREKMTAVPLGRGREAITHFVIVESYGKKITQPIASLVECRLETGRTHQIRVHLSYLGHPLLGDNLYGSGHKTKAALLDDASRAHLNHLDRQALHATVLGFEHPTTGLHLKFQSPLPADLAALRDALIQLSS